MRTLRNVVVGLVGAIALVGIVFVTGMRAKSPPVLGAVRRVGRATKSLPLKTAGQAGNSTSVVEHVGRRSGRRYGRPSAPPDRRRFVIALPYGTDTDWLQNVLAAGSATYRHDGHSHGVERPALVPLHEFDDQFSTADQKAHRLFKVELALHVHAASDEV